jgi:hypothetical protein
MIRRIALQSGDDGRIDHASLDALNSARPWALSIAITEQTTAREMIQRLAASVNAVAGVSWLGKLYVVPVGIETPAITLHSDGSALPPVASVEQVEVGSPWWRLAIQAERTWAVHTQTSVQYLEPAEPAATAGAPDGTYVGTKLAQTLVDELNFAGTLAVEGEYFVNRMESADPVTGYSRATLFVNADGIIAAQSLIAGPDGAVIGWMADEFYWYDSNGGSPRQAGKIVDGVWTMHDVEIDRLKVGSVIRQSISPGAVTDSATFTAPDVTITSASEITVVETPFFEVGDALYGKALAGVSFLQDGTSSFDTSMRVRAYVDTGAGYTLIRDRVHGIDFDSGNARFSMPVAFTLRVSSATPARIKVTAQASYVSGSWGTLGSSVARDIGVDLFRG